MKIMCYHKNVNMKCMGKGACIVNFSLLIEHSLIKLNTYLRLCTHLEHTTKCLEHGSGQMDPLEHPHKHIIVQHKTGY